MTSFPNPERGLYHHEEAYPTGYAALDATALRGYRTSEGISLVLRMWYLSGFQASDISAAYLAGVQQDLDAIRTAGLKAVVRFAYTADESGLDASKAWVLRHIAQLGPILTDDADVVAAVQVGFIGAWGEWYYTQHFGNDGVVSDAQWQDRRDVVDALLAALPAGVPVQLRTPAQKQRLYGAAPLSAVTAFSGTAASRVGHHDDCFLASADDMGTYVDVAADKAYLAQENLYVPQGGETCAVSSYSDWTHAAADLAALHWSFLNVDYEPSVLTSWGANLDEVKRRLGYRLALVRGTYATSATPGGDLAVSFTIRNDGWAAPFRSRSVELVLRPKAGGAVHRFALAADPRRWVPGATTVTETVRLAGVPAGQYDLLLALPDPATGLASRPEYAIRLANAGLWEASTGLHALQQAVTVAP